MTALWISLGVLAALLLADLLGARALIRLTLERNRAQDADPLPDGTPAWQAYYDRAEEGKAWLLSQPHETCEIRSFDGLRLRAVWVPAAEPTDRTILCLHGYRANGCFDFGAQSRFLRGLGWNLLLPDDRAHGQSEGRYIGFGNLDSRDCLSWCRFLAERYPEGPVVLCGVSMGAAAVLAASGDPALPPQVRGVAADCGFSSGWEEVRLQMKNFFHLPAFPLLPTADFLLRRLAGYSLRDREAVRQVRNTRVPLLVIHGGADTFVPARMGQEIFDAAGCDKRLLLVPGAVHAHSYLTDTAAWESAFRDLLERSLRAGAAPASPAPAER